MDRRKLLKKTCGMSLCSCLPLAATTDASADEAAPKPRLLDWQIDFMRSRLEDLLEIVATTLDEPTRARVLGRLGQACGGELAKKFRGNPEGFWAYARQQWIDRVDYDENRGTIRVLERERTHCNCPLAAILKVPKTMCLCSLGTQEVIYRSLFSRSVTVRQEESVLRGDTRCSFTITLGREIEATADETEAT
jgi:hypothetical protein